MAQSWDLPYKETEKSSYAVCTVWGRVGANKYLLDRYRERIGFNDQLRAVMDMKRRWPGSNAIWIEDATNAQAIVDTLKNQVTGVIAVRPDGSKQNRIEAVSPQIEAGNVFLPDRSVASWVDEFIDEFTVCPNGKYWDQIDSTSQALIKIEQRKIPEFGMISITGESKWRGI
jgi:predicted phage terminase large subunit-like protein